MNDRVYAHVIELLKDNKQDWRDIVYDIAAHDPQAVVYALTDQKAISRAVEAEFDEHGKIKAIILYKNLVSCTLKEAKAWVENRF